LVRVLGRARGRPRRRPGFFLDPAADDGCKEDAGNFFMPGAFVTAVVRQPMFSAPTNYTCQRRLASSSEGVQTRLKKGNVNGRKQGVSLRGPAMVTHAPKRRTNGNGSTARKGPPPETARIGVSRPAWRGTMLICRPSRSGIKSWWMTRSGRSSGIVARASLPVWPPPPDGSFEQRMNPCQEDPAPGKTAWERESLALRGGSAPGAVTRVWVQVLKTRQSLRLFERWTKRE
jgi:hypothetical protein